MRNLRHVASFEGLQAIILGRQRFAFVAWRSQRMFFSRCIRAFFLCAAAPLFVCAVTPLAAQTAAPSDSGKYDPRLTFAPLALPDPVNQYRSSNGAPGPAYWQNEADYEMHASIDTTAKVLRNTETITYTNNSPDTLTSLWIHLEQNIYRQD